MSSNVWSRMLGENSCELCFKKCDDFKRVKVDQYNEM